MAPALSLPNLVFFFACCMCGQGSLISFCLYFNACKIHSFFHSFIHSGSQKWKSVRLINLNFSSSSHFIKWGQWIQQNNKYSNDELQLLFKIWIAKKRSPTFFHSISKHCSSITSALLIFTFQLVRCCVITLSASSSKRQHSEKTYILWAYQTDVGQTLMRCNSCSYNHKATIVHITSSELVF